MLFHKFPLLFLVSFSFVLNAQNTELRDKDLVGTWQLFRVQEGDSMRMLTSSKDPEGIMFRKDGLCMYNKASIDPLVRIKESKGRWKIRSSGKIKAAISYKWQKVNKAPSGASPARSMENRYGRARKRRMVFILQPVKTQDEGILLRVRTGNSTYMYYKKM
jgi:hypothetical protein